MKYCPKCITKLPDAHNFCFMCGTELTTEPPLKCFKCDTVLDSIYEFCPTCGTKVK